MNYEKLKDILMEEVDGDTLLNMVRDCNGWNGSLEEYRFEYNDEDFYDTYFSGEPYKLAMALNSHEANTNDEYIRMDVYGDLVTYTNSEVEQELLSNKEEIIDQFLELLERYNVDKYTISEHIDTLENLEEEYQEYVDEWHETHEEGEPAEFNEWYDMEYNIRA